MFYNTKGGSEVAGHNATNSNHRDIFSYSKLNVAGRFRQRLRLRCRAEDRKIVRRSRNRT